MVTDNVWFNFCRLIIDHNFGICTACLRANLNSSHSCSSYDCIHEVIGIFKGLFDNPTYTFVFFKKSLSSIKLNEQSIARYAISLNAINMSLKNQIKATTAKRLRYICSVSYRAHTYNITDIFVWTELTVCLN